MTVALDWIVAVVLAFWFLAIVLANIPVIRPRLVRHDTARLLPNWALFAAPRVADLTILRRDLLRDGALTKWREVDTAGPRRWYNFIWNPDLGTRRAFLALSSSIVGPPRPRPRPPATSFGQGSPAAWRAMTRVPYLTLLHYLSERSNPAVEATQFMIVSVRGQAITGRYDNENDNSSDESIEFVSEFHLVRPRVLGPSIEHSPSRVPV
jgi:hypothetical protein